MLSPIVFTLLIIFTYTVTQILDAIYRAKVSKYRVLGAITSSGVVADDYLYRPGEEVPDTPFRRQLKSYMVSLPLTILSLNCLLRNFSLVCV